MRTLVINDSKSDRLDDGNETTVAARREVETCDSADSRGLSTAAIDPFDVGHSEVRLPERW
ncbi:MAG TPA: hypothetical protein VFR46_05085, partial [Actinomycetes bacterium]|nr:hypothetical protein [Actinomycetes bacterium]